MLAVLTAPACISPTSVQEVPTIPPPTETLSGQNDWQLLAPGLERRSYDPDSSNPIARMIALRIDPARFSFRAHYRPGEPLTTREWFQELGGATAFVNANFFDPQNQIVGLLVADGQVYGSSYTDRGGMFSIQNGQVVMQALLRQPYGGEVLEQAVQAFPMLVIDGDQSFRDDLRDRPTRRTVIGQDSLGRVILMATPLLGLPLRELSAYLADADLDLVTAFNLDGGGSTMMGLSIDGSTEYVVSSLDPVPAVLAVYPRG